MKDKGFVLTMQYNDDFFLPIWLKHYSQYFRSNQIYVIDHGSDKNIVPDHVNRIYVPRDKGFDEIERLSVVHGIVFSLMKCYDWGVFCDSDELVDLDNFTHDEMDANQTIFTYGFDLFQVNVCNEKRIYGLLNSTMCKPQIFNHDYPDWSTGFHGIKNASRPEIYNIMGHIKYLFRDAYKINQMNRMSAYSSMKEADKSKGIAQQWNDPFHEDRIYQNMQEIISNTILTDSLSKIPIEWINDLNMGTMFKPTSEPIIMDLTSKFFDLLVV